MSYYGVSDGCLLPELKITLETLGPLNFRDGDTLVVTLSQESYNRYSVENLQRNFEYLLKHMGYKKSKVAVVTDDLKLSVIRSEIGKNGLEKAMERVSESDNDKIG